MYKVIKTRLKNVVRDESTIEVIEDVVLTMHKITIHTLQFLKLYYIHFYNIEGYFPEVTQLFIVNIMNTICEKKVTNKFKGESRKLMEEFASFYNEFYKPLIFEKEILDPMFMKNIFEYTAVNIITVFENNIKQHYVEYVERYINVKFNKKERLEQIKENKELSSEDKEKEKKEIITELRNIKKSVLSLENVKLSDMCLPDKKEFKESVYYDLQCYSQDYFLPMYEMMLEVESKGEKTYNLFPLRSDIVPKYVKLDTLTIIDLFLSKGIDGIKKTKLKANGNLTENQDNIWSLIFKTESRVFRNDDEFKYRFNYMIETDGVGVSILLIETCSKGKKYSGKKIVKQEETYFHELDRNSLRDKYFVSIDPNMGDLLHCNMRSPDGNEKLRYTQNQRRKETKMKRDRNILQEKKKCKITRVSYSKGRKINISDTPANLEARLSKFNKKTLNFNEFCAYVKEKNKVNSRLTEFYNESFFRQNRMNTYSNTQRSEQKFINRFKEKYGGPTDVIIGIGDWEQYKHMKFKEPVKGKGFRKLFRKNGYQVNLVDEHKTSKMCFNCQGGTCETFRTCPNPRPWRKEETIKRHGLLMCKSCSTIWCRDNNSSLNILRIMQEYLRFGKRPRYLCRGRVNVSGATSVST